MTSPPEPLLAAELAARLSTAVSGLDDLDRRPLAEHVAVFEDLHTVLGEVLTAGAVDPGRT